MIHILLGTKAQYTKMAPLLHLMDVEGVEYRLIDTGQHARFNRTLRPSIGVREPDVTLDGDDSRTVGQGLRWLARMTGWWFRRRALRAKVFGHDEENPNDAASGDAPQAWCVVHGDTASTLVGTALARRAGLKVAMVEAGLRSGSVFNPFPEELIRTWVPRRSQLLFPPDQIATERLARMRVKGRVVPTSGNTVIETLFATLQGVFGDDVASWPSPGQGPVVVQLHRMENLHRRWRLESFIELVCRVAGEHPVRFVVHGATEAVLERRRLLPRLQAAGVHISGLLPSYREFIGLLYQARFVVTDGASLQEECAALGVPTLLWRAHTERPDGLGTNIELAKYDPQITDRFLADPQAWRRDAEPLASRPSRVILNALLEDLATATGDGNATQPTR